jgi:hypothetical protein
VITSEIPPPILSMGGASRSAELHSQTKTKGITDRDHSWRVEIRRLDNLDQSNSLWNVAL